MSLQFVKSLPITTAMLTATNVSEADYAEWAAGTTYASGARVIVGADHKVYESLQASNIGKVPATELLWWVEVGPTNRWKLFDLSNSTTTASATDAYYELTPGIVCNSVCLLNIDGVTSVRIRVTDPVFGVVYDKTTAIEFIPSESGWYAWFFGSRRKKRDLLALDLPSYPNAVIRVDLTGAPVVGVLTIGKVNRIGMGVRQGVRVGIQDYSRKERNQWGDTVLVQRAYAKRASLSVMLENSELDDVHAMLADMRATPCVWVGHEPYVSTMVFGFYKEFDINIAYANYSECTLDIEGLT